MSFPTKYYVDVGEALGLFNVLQWLADMHIDRVWPSHYNMSESLFL